MAVTAHPQSSLSREKKALECAAETYENVKDLEWTRDADKAAVRQHAMRQALDVMLAVVAAPDVHVDTSSWPEDD